MCRRIGNVKIHAIIGGGIKDTFHIYGAIFPNDPRLIGGKSALQIGCRGAGAAEVFKGLQINGYDQFDGLEIFKENAESFYHNPWGIKIRKMVVGDIRKIDEYTELLPKYDIIIFHHGPEHIYENEFIEVLPKIMNKCNKAFVIGAPWGIKINKRGDRDGNENEEHVKHWYPHEWINLGFDVYCYNNPGRPFMPDVGNVMMGIKYKE